MSLHDPWLAYAIIIPATAGVIIRPFRLPEAVWAVAGAILLVALGLITTTDALAGIRKGLDVYLFLIGMMLIAELARREGLFDYLAAYAVEHARAEHDQIGGVGDRQHEARGIGDERADIEIRQRRGAGGARCGIDRGGQHDR
ncbi:MAG: hypothetical protein E6575_15405, partial [Bradyrhizobium sp.]|nr:hypothetical protein [Bradyrhizobium sp.]